MGKAKNRTGDRHVGTPKTIRFTDEQAARLDAAKDRLGGTYAEVIDAALRALDARAEPSNAELIAMLEARLNEQGIKLARGVEVRG